MGVGFDSDSFLATHITPFLQDPGLSKRLVFHNVTRDVSAEGSQTETETTSETTGIVESNPSMDATTLKQVFSDGEISREVVKVFFVESELSFEIKNGQVLDIYESGTLLGKYRVKFAPRNMVVTAVCVAYCVSSE